MVEFNELAFLNNSTEASCDCSKPKMNILVTRGSTSRPIGAFAMSDFSKSRHLDVISTGTSDRQTVLCFRGNAFL